MTASYASSYDSKESSERVGVKDKTSETVITSTTKANEIQY